MIAIGLIVLLTLWTGVLVLRAVVTLLLLIALRLGRL